MRNLIVSSLVSLEGIHGDPQSRAGDYFDEQAAEQSLAVLLDSDAMLMGRNTHDYLAPAWSSLSGPYLERINQMRKYVVSSTLTAADWTNTTIISGDPVAAVRNLKEQGDRHLVIYGYGQLARMLLEHGLVGELNFVVNRWDAATMIKKRRSSVTERPAHMTPTDAPPSTIRRILRPWHRRPRLRATFGDGLAAGGPSA